MRMCVFVDAQMKTVHLCACTDEDHDISGVGAQIRACICTCTDENGASVLCTDEDDTSMWVHR